jgi:hypothetical protein
MPVHSSQRARFAARYLSTDAIYSFAVGLEFSRSGILRVGNEPWKHDTKQR